MSTNPLELKNTIIGRGEKATLEILQWMLPKYTYFTQASIRRLLDMRAPKVYYPVAERYKKSSIDILLAFDKNDNLRLTKARMVAVQIQDNHHTGEVTSKVDNVIRDILKDCKIDLIEVHERNCKELFKNRINPKSIWELCNEIMTSKVKL